VLREIEADQAPSLLVLNKIDRVDDDTRAALRTEFPDAFQMSARDSVDVARLRETILERVTAEMTEEEIFVPYASHAVAAAFHAQAQVVRETHEDDGTRMLVRAAPEVLERLKGHLRGD
jgi:GTP-binding protein HflX